MRILCRSTLFVSLIEDRGETSASGTSVSGTSEKTPVVPVSVEPGDKWKRKFALALSNRSTHVSAHRLRYQLFAVGDPAVMSVIGRKLTGWSKFLLNGRRFPVSFDAAGIAMPCHRKHITAKPACASARGRQVSTVLS